MTALHHWSVRQSSRLLILVGICFVLLASAVQAAASSIEVLTVKGSINPVVADYIKRGITKAETDNAVVCVIQMDTPGGLDTSMRSIVQEIVNSTVPVVLYVAPSGARAASAGVFITISAHVAAMAPNTNIGAAHPVSISTTGEAPSSDIEQQKILNDAVAYIRSIAEGHGRNADWAEQAVRQSVSITEQEALTLHVVDIIAPDLDSLLSQLDGREVTLLEGNKKVLHTKGTPIVPVNMNWIENFLHAIADPNVAYVLLGIAALGIFTEIFSPGLIFPGVIGGIAGLLAFYALGMLPVNLTGVLLIVLAFILFIIEAVTAGFGVLAVGGIASLVIGSLILFKGGAPGMRVSLWLIGIVTLIIATFFAFVVQRVVAVHLRQSTTGREEVIGKTVTVRTPLNPQGQVLFHGERWQAISESGNIDIGETVVITRIDGLTLYVKGPEKPVAASAEKQD